MRTAAALALNLALASSALGQWQPIYMHDPVLTESQILAITPDRQYGDMVYQNRIRATSWSGTPTSWTMYNPGPQVTSGTIFAASGTAQGGTLNGRATIWIDGPTSAIDIHPAGFWISDVLAMDGSQQAGRVFVQETTFENAVVWNGTAASAVNLHPASGAQWSVATGVANGEQCGYIWRSGGGGYSACMWAGTAASMTLLHPSVAIESQAMGMVDGQQVGWYRRPGQNARAALWSGSAQSLLDMHPPGAGVSRLLATCGSAQVGWASTSDGFVAGIWFGSAESFVSLGSLLPPGFTSSIATSVAERDGIYYVGGYGVGPLGKEAWMWVGVPAPGTASLLIGMGVVAARRRRRQSARAVRPPSGR